MDRTGEEARAWLNAGGEGINGGGRRQPKWNRDAEAVPRSVEARPELAGGGWAAETGSDSGTVGYNLDR